MHSQATNGKDMRLKEIIKHICLFCSLILIYAKGSESILASQKDKHISAVQKKETNRKQLSQTSIVPVHTNVQKKASGLYLKNNDERKASSVTTSARWTQVYGRGGYDSPGTTNADLWDTTKTAVFYIRRLCIVCADSHQHIIYKRLTDVPDGTDLQKLFISQWYDNGPIPNQFNIDFMLFSTFDDAINDNNAWTYCNFNLAGVGCKWVSSF